MNDRYIRLENGMYECKTCQKSFKPLGFDSHYKRKHTEEGIALAKSISKKCNAGYADGTRHGWCKGKTKETCESLQKSIRTFKTNYENGKFKLGSPHTEATKKRLSESALKSKHRRLRRKMIEYVSATGEIIKLDSSYELTVAKFLDEHDVVWIRPDPLQYATLDNITHNYFPDFYIPHLDVYLDPKNDYLIETQSDKIRLVKEQNEVQIYVLSKRELTNEKLREILKL